MKIRSLGYNIKQGFKNIYRNKMFSLASIATMTACLFLFGVFYSIVTNFQYMVKKAENSVCVTVFFDEGLSDQQKSDIGKNIESRVEVQNFTIHLPKKHGVHSAKIILDNIRIWRKASRMTILWHLQILTWYILMMHQCSLRL